MDKQPLFNNTACSSICTTNSTISPIADYLQTKLAASTNSDTAEFLCKTLNLYTDQTVIFLPNDYIFMQWDIENGNSQIEDFYVGFGSSPTEREYPNILDYKSSDRKLNFRHQHEAIGSTELFYIFIKAVNKAGITSVATLGPILIDETPPLWRSIPNVSIDGEKVVFGWEAGTFFDEEQTGPINQIVFQFRK
ncbi:hypothetical protein DPMN_175863 [Dreissena polymorpha]|uniref:Uncharacterized protein n=1 Tax=Dreissena polymorpha TaxID=45954 RepID=A0A9D4E7A3_DREPO|nr:hypothetical protein DPMN_175863 [Dreissena polymorpha]